MKCATLFSSVSSPSWEDKNPAGICLLPPQVMEKWREGGSWADSEPQSTVPKGGTGTMLKATTPGSQPEPSPPVPRYRRGGERRAAGPPDTRWAIGTSGGAPGTVAAASCPLREARLDRQPQGFEGGRRRGRSTPARSDPVKVLEGCGGICERGDFCGEGGLRRVREGQPAGRWGEEGPLRSADPSAAARLGLPRPLQARPRCCASAGREAGLRSATRAGNVPGPRRLRGPMDPEGAATDQMQTESLPSCPNTVSPVRLNNLIGSPRFGTVTPNRVFVGGIDFKTNENDLKKFFAQYGSVTEVKIINDRAGVSKGYGFVTFETQEEAQKILQDAKKLNYKDKKLNIGPAIRKQVRSPNARSAVTPQAGTMYATTAVSPEAGTMYLTTSSGYPYVYHNGVAYFHTSEVSPVQQPWPSRSVSSSPVMVAPPVYQSPTYHYQAPTQCLSSQWQWSVPQSPTSSPPLLYLQPSEVFYQPIGINQEGGCISPPLLMEAAVPELYSDHGVQTLHHQPYVQSHIAMPAASFLCG